MTQKMGLTDACVIKDWDEATLRVLDGAYGQLQCWYNLHEKKIVDKKLRKHLKDILERVKYIAHT
jgi:hypothetical protein